MDACGRAGVRACGFWVAHRNIHPHFQIPPRLRIFKRQKEHKKKRKTHPSSAGVIAWAVEP